MATAIEEATVNTTTLRDQLVVFRNLMNEHLIERDEEVDAALTGLLCGENVLLVGDPGTAKSLLSAMICQWIDGKKFEVLISKFTTPEETIGPVSVKGLRDDEYRRILTGRLADVDVAFIDELFKASSAILNSMLQILNERRLTNGLQVVDCPLKLVIGASNEWPDEAEELGALFDRFLIRRTVKTIQTARGRSKLLWSEVDADRAVSDNEPEAIEFLGNGFNPVPVSAADVATMQKEAMALPFTKESREAFESIIVDLKKNGISPGDRRLRKSVGACRAFAYLNGEDRVTSESLAILSDTLWDDPHEQPTKVQEVVLSVASPEKMVVNGLIMESREVESKIDRGDIGSISEGIKKMQDTAKRLKGMSSEPAKRAYESVTARIGDLKRAALETANIG